MRLGLSTKIGLSNNCNPSAFCIIFQSIPPTWRPFYNSMKRRVGGDPETPEGQEFLEARSPIFYAKQIKKPLLIAQGANDPRVLKRESDQIFKVTL